VAVADGSTGMARRMSDAEALMWIVEKDPALRSAFLQLTILDGPPDFDRLRARMVKAVANLPRLGQRVVAAPLGRLAPPEWADDPTFDIDFHVRRTRLTGPGDDRELLDLAAAVYEDPFDRARPLWQLLVVEGLAGGRAAMLVKMHHTITDGVGGVRLSLQFIDLAREPGEADADAAAPAHAVPASAGASPIAVAAGALGHQVRRQVGVAQRLVRSGASMAAHPTRLPSTVVDGVETVRSVVRQGAVTSPARSPLWREADRSSRRRFELLSVELERLKRAAKDLGGTVNDAFVTAVAGGAGAYHRAKGAPVDELRMAMPVNRRPSSSDGDDSVGGNAFTPLRVVVPVGPDPVERFEGVRARLSTTKRERAIGVTEGLAGVLGMLPTSVLVRLARQQATTVDFATSNLRGAPFDLFVAGAEILANHPMGPTAGTAFNATAMSYRGAFDVGLAIDAAAVEDPVLLRECVEEGFRELFAAAGA
jgi:WS/DGAT/MGAT family acyltransferase